MDVFGYEGMGYVLTDRTSVWSSKLSTLYYWKSVYKSVYPSTNLKTLWKFYRIPYLQGVWVICAYIICQSLFSYIFSTA